MKIINDHENKSKDTSRRGFIQKSGLWIAGAGVVGLSGIAVSCKNQENSEKEEEEEEMVSANEDLMREHGLLNRMLLVYDTAIGRMTASEEFNPNYINQTATIIRNFVEDYHEKLEEDYLFPRLEKANKLTGLTSTLRKQHKAGRGVTEQLLSLTNNGRALKGDDSKKIVDLLKAFNTMYRPHEAREDTVLFPAFKQVVSQHEYDALGEDFEKKEHEKFGEGGFDAMVDKVATIEKQIGVYELDQFTPKI
ncbi:hemerythrin domain-containing protein [Zunongwangia sp. H14]|uniref:hemerythrin domain-containing protein n=1 Tax=Zunongwangia sp. H14 TaxID=3240792 RepID=UPI003568E738